MILVLLNNRKSWSPTISLKFLMIIGCVEDVYINGLTGRGCLVELASNYKLTGVLGVNIFIIY